MNRIGVDVGGTFTDLILLEQERVVVHKLPSTPADPSQAVINGISELCAKAGIDPRGIDRLNHGTTVATNIVLEHNGSRVGMITTEGFRDILHIGRKKRPYNFSLYLDVPWQTNPLVRRRYRLTVKERIDAHGSVLVPLDEEGVRVAARKLNDMNVDAITIAFLNSFVNPVHEQRAKEIVISECPDLYVCTSSEILPQYREYERFSTAALNAYVGPKTARYLHSLEHALENIKVKSELHLMQSTGGTATVDASVQKPVTLMMSGPAGGLIAGTQIAKNAGYKSTITLDIGGTSADIGVAPGGEIRMKHLLDTRVGDYSCMVPMVDMDTIGAGGGSIAYVDEGGMFRVGPQSAGSDPGPACYDRGGSQPTTTDCNLVLGRIRNKGLVGGNFELKPSLSKDVIQDNLCARLGLGLEEAALGALRIMVNNMVRAIELNSVRKGYDPREFVLVGFGGAGPMYACEIAQEIGIPTVLIPPNPGITSATGLLTTDTSYEFVRTTFANIENVNVEIVNKLYDDLEREAMDRLLKDGANEEDILLTRFADCRYQGQGYELRVPVSSGTVNSQWVTNSINAFHEAHERQYFHRFDAPVEIVNIRVVGISKEQDINWGIIPQGGPDASNAIVSEGVVWFWEDNKASAYTTSFYRRDKLKSGNVINGPAIIEQFDSTTVVPPNMVAKVDRFGNLIVTSIA